MRPSEKPLGPAASRNREERTRREERAGPSAGTDAWAHRPSVEDAQLAGRAGDVQDCDLRASDVLEEGQPYYTRAPFQKAFGGARAGEERGVAEQAKANARVQAAAHYGLVTYSRSGLSPRGKGPSRPGTSLGGGAAIRKLSKLDAKDQDDVNDVTEDEDRGSPGGMEAVLHLQKSKTHSYREYQQKDSSHRASSKPQPQAS